MKPHQRWILIGTAAGALILLGIFVFWLRQRSTEGLRSVPPTASTTTAPAPTPVSADIQQKIDAEMARLNALPPDSDGDGLPDAEEQKLGTDIRKVDTDGDGSTDFEEVYLRHTNPLNPDPLSPPAHHRLSSVVPTSTQETAPAQAVAPPPATTDSDGDGLTDGEEVSKYLTNPLKADSDGDGYPDGVEVKTGYNPLGTGRCTRPNCVP